MSIVETLNKHDIKSIWHFTDKSNLKSIEKYGIRSLYEIITTGIEVSRFGADNRSHNLDRRYGLDKYVHLAFINDHPMYHVACGRGSIITPVWIELDLSLMFEETTIFSDRVANGKYAEIFNIDDVERMIDFKKMHIQGNTQDRREARKAEIMVANNISTDQILGVYYGK